MKATGRDVIAGNPPKFPFLCRFIGSVISEHPSFKEFVKHPRWVDELSESDVSFMRMLAKFAILFLRQGSLSEQEFAFLHKLKVEHLPRSTAATSGWPASRRIASMWHEFAKKEWKNLRREWVGHVCRANEPDVEQPQSVEANNQEEQPDNDIQ